MARHEIRPARRAHECARYERSRAGTLGIHAAGMDIRESVAGAAGTLRAGMAADGHVVLTRLERSVTAARSLHSAGLALSSLCTAFAEVTG